MSSIKRNPLLSPGVVPVMNYSSDSITIEHMWDGIVAGAALIKTMQFDPMLMKTFNTGLDAGKIRYTDVDFATQESFVSGVSAALVKLKELIKKFIEYIRAKLNKSKIYINITIASILNKVNKTKSDINGMRSKYSTPETSVDGAIVTDILNRGIKGATYALYTDAAAFLGNDEPDFNNIVTFLTEYSEIVEVIRLQAEAAMKIADTIDMNAILQHGTTIRNTLANEMSKHADVSKFISNGRYQARYTVTDEAYSATDNWIHNRQFIGNAKELFNEKHGNPVIVAGANNGLIFHSTQQTITAFSYEPIASRQKVSNDTAATLIRGLNTGNVNRIEQVLDKVISISSVFKAAINEHRDKNLNALLMELAKLDLNAHTEGEIANILAGITTIKAIVKLDVGCAVMIGKLADYASGYMSLVNQFVTIKTDEAAMKLYMQSHENFEYVMPIDDANPVMDATVSMLDASNTLTEAMDKYDGNDENSVTALTNAIELTKEAINAYANITGSAVPEVLTRENLAYTRLQLAGMTRESIADKMKEIVARVIAWIKEQFAKAKGYFDIAMIERKLTKLHNHMIDKSIKNPLIPGAMIEFSFENEKAKHIYGYMGRYTGILSKKSDNVINFKEVLNAYIHGCCALSTGDFYNAIAIASVKEISSLVVNARSIISYDDIIKKFAKVLLDTIKKFRVYGGYFNYHDENHAVIIISRTVLLYIYADTGEIEFKKVPESYSTSKPLNTKAIIFTTWSDVHDAYKIDCLRHGNQINVGRVMNNVENSLLSIVGNISDNPEFIRAVRYMTDIITKLITLHTNAIGDAVDCIEILFNNSIPTIRDNQHLKKFIDILGYVYDVRLFIHKH